MNRLSRQICGEITRRIQEGSFGPGDRLPPERRLAEMFGVSRTVVREALRSLQERDLVFVDGTRGTFVQHELPGEALQAGGDGLSEADLSFIDLVECRLTIEVRIAELAAARQNPQAIDRLEAHLDSMHRSIARPCDFKSADIRFHAALTAAAENRVYVMSARPILSSVAEMKYDVTEFGAVRERILRCHRDIFDAVRCGDAERARICATAHIFQFVRDIRMGIELGILPHQNVAGTEGLFAPDRRDRTPLAGLVM